MDIRRPEKQAWKEGFVTTFSWKFEVNFGKLQLGGGVGDKTYRAIFFWGGKRTTECALQNQFWRPQKVGLVWSAPVPSKESDRAWTKGGGELYHRWVGGGVQNLFGEGFYGMFSPPLSFPPPFAALWKDCLRNINCLLKACLKFSLREAKPGCFQTRVFSHFFREWSRLCRGPFRDCSS